MDTEPKKRRLDWECVKNVAAEFTGSTIYIFLGCFSWYYTRGTDSFVLGAVFGGAALYAYQAFERFSGGHVSPCVTIGAMIMRKTHWIEGLLYIPFQLLGAFFGFILVYAMLPTRSNNYHWFESDFCCVHRFNDISLLGLIIIELIGSTVYMIIWCTLWLNKNENVKLEDPIFVGVGLAAILIPSNTFTGSGVNPFRALPPAIAASYYQDIWVYLILPFIPAIAVPFIFYYWNKRFGSEEEEN